MEIQFDEKKKRAKLIVNTGSGKNRKRHTKTISYQRKKDAEKAWVEFEQEVSGGIETSMTVEELIDWYIEGATLTGIKATTLRAYNVARKPLTAFFKGYKAHMVTTYHVDRFITAELKKRSAKTIKNEVSLLSAAYIKGEKNGILTNNPCKNATLPSVQRADVSALDSENYDTFVKCLREDPDTDFRVAIELALFCGLRSSEILALTPADINLDAGTVSINKSRHRVDGKDIIQPPKTKQSHRIIALPGFLVRDISQLLDEHSSAVQSADYIIQNRFGERVTWNWLQKHLNEFLERNGLDHITMHGLRHTHATLLIKNGFEVAEVSKQLGHAQISTTLNVYTHEFENAAVASRKAANMFDADVPPFCHPVAK